MVNKSLLVNIIIAFSIISIYLGNANPVAATSEFRGRNRACFKMGNTENLFTIRHDLVKIPDYLQMKSTFRLVHTDPNTPDNITTSTYDMIQQDEPCSCAYGFFSKEKEFSFIELDVKLYTGNDFGLLAHFKAKLYPGFERNLDLLIDEDKKIGFGVTYRPDGPHFIQPSKIMTESQIIAALANKRVDNTLLCVKTESKQDFIIRPMYLEMAPPTRHVSGITAYFYFRNNQTIAWTMSFTAYGCGSHASYTTNDLLFVEERSKGFDFIWTVEYINSYEYLFNDYDQFLNKEQFNLENMNFLRLTDSKTNIDPTNKNIFLTPANYYEDICEDGREETMGVSMFGTVQYVVMCSMEVDRAIQMRACVPTTSLTSCRARR